MKFQYLLFTILFLALSVDVSFGQDEPFKGGIGDGYSIDTVNVAFLSFTAGSVEDGFGHAFLLTSYNDFTFGGIGDGYTKVESENLFLDFTRGGDSDGFSAIYAEDNFNTIYKGGVSDGFAYSKYGHIIFWTGNQGTGWNVAENWENDIIPSYCNPVVIPSGVPNFPAVNSGVLRIGYYKDEGDYRCQRIKIEMGAEMLTRVNCFIENYDLILNRGKLFVKNPAVDAFKNIGDAVILIKPNSEIFFKE